MAEFIFAITVDDLVKNSTMPFRGTGNQNNFEQWASVVIKFKPENCLNVLKIVNKEPIDILL